jgi:hypothetical protein
MHGVLLHEGWQRLGGMGRRAKEIADRVPSKTLRGWLKTEARGTIHTSKGNGMHGCDEGFSVISHWERPGGRKGE